MHKKHMVNQDEKLIILITMLKELQLTLNCTHELSDHEVWRIASAMDPNLGDLQSLKRIIFALKSQGKL